VIAVAPKIPFFASGSGSGSGSGSTAPIDAVCLKSYSYLNGGSVHADYDCMLNQSDLAKNANKFYKIQVSL